MGNTTFLILSKKNYQHPVHLKLNPYFKKSFISDYLMLFFGRSDDNVWFNFMTRNKINYYHDVDSYRSIRHACCEELRDTKRHAEKHAFL